MLAGAEQQLNLRLDATTEKSKDAPQNTHVLESTWLPLPRKCIHSCRMSLCNCVTILIDMSLLQLHVPDQGKGRERQRGTTWTEQHEERDTKRDGGYQTWWAKRQKHTEKDMKQTKAPHTSTHTQSHFMGKEEVFIKVYQKAFFFQFNFKKIKIFI